MNLIILSPDDAVAPDTYRLTFHRAEHVRSVLRSEVGDILQVGVINGPAGSARVEHMSETEVILCTGTLSEQPRPHPTVDLICALPRPQTLRKVLFTCGMMGVRRLHLVRANRVEKSYFHSPLLDPDKYTPHLIEGMSQGKLTRLPEVTVHGRFRTFFEDTLLDLEAAETDKAMKILPDPESRLHLRTLYRGREPRLLIAVGPEGGWVPFETETMQRLGFQRFNLARWTLRVETAVTAVLSQIELVRAMEVT